MILFHQVEILDAFDQRQSRDDGVERGGGGIEVLGVVLAEDKIFDQVRRHALLVDDRVDLHADAADDQRQDAAAKHRGMPGGDSGDDDGDEYADHQQPQFRCASRDKSPGAAPAPASCLRAKA